MRFLLCVLAVGCVAPEPADPSPIDEPTPPPGEESPGDPPPAPMPVTVTLDALEPGWRVTTTELVATTAPDEHTVISDGSPITLVAGAGNMFVALVTDVAGNLVGAHAMGARCNLSAQRRLDVPQEYPTIQSAIDAAMPGDTVKVAAGTYSESLAMRPGVCLLGSGAKHTVLDANGEGRSLIDLTTGAGSVVSGFTIRGTRQGGVCSYEGAPSDPFDCSGNWYEAGIYAAPGYEHPSTVAPALIMNNVFESNDIGVLLWFHALVIVRNNVFVANRYGFVANHFQDRTLIANNVFLNNTEAAIGNQAAYLDIIDNIIAGSPLGIRFEYIQTGHIRCNVFFANGANQNDDRFTIGTNGNVEVEPHLVGNGDYRLQSSSPAKGAGCHGNHVIQPNSLLPDIGVYGGPLAAWVDL